MSIFGWSLPPGCGTLPGEEDYYCAVCGQIDNNCVCDECPECGEVGNPDCHTVTRHDGPHMKLHPAVELVGKLTSQLQDTRGSAIESYCAEEELKLLVGRCAKAIEILKEKSFAKYTRSEWKLIHEALREAKEKGYETL